MNSFFIKQKKSAAGFTLIELLVVIAIIGILASTVLASLGSARSSARDARRISDIKQLQTAMELFRNANGGLYPCQPPLATPPGDGAFVMNMNAAVNDSPAGCADITPYMTTLPLDPVYTNTTNGYRYAQGAGRTSYTLAVKMESKIFPKADNANNTWCSVSMGTGAAWLNGTNPNGNFPPCF